MSPLIQDEQLFVLAWKCLFRFPQSLPNSQCPLSDMPRLHVADESNMAAKMDELEIFRYPGNARSKVWEYFGFHQVKEGPTLTSI